MGYVFTPEEFEKGMIPSLEDYHKANGMSVKGLESLYNDNIIHGSNIHGSRFHPDFNTGSDLDVLVTINPNKDAEDYLKGLAIHIKNATYVPVEWVTVHKHLAESGNHDLDYYYVLYIKTFCRDGIIGNNSIDIIAPGSGWDNPKQEVNKRMKHQLAWLSKRRARLYGFDKEHCAFLEKLIRQPVYSAIDVLRCKEGNYPSENGKPMSKDRCCYIYMNMEEHSPIRGDLDRVLNMRNRYRKFLKSREDKSPDEYMMLLEDINNTYHSAFNVIEFSMELLG